MPGSLSPFAPARPDGDFVPGTVRVIRTRLGAGRQRKRFPVGSRAEAIRLGVAEKRTRIRIDVTPTREPDTDTIEVESIATDVGVQVVQRST